MIGLLAAGRRGRVGWPTNNWLALLADDTPGSLTLREPMDEGVDPVRRVLTTTVADLRGRSNVFFDAGAVRYFLDAGGVVEGASFDERRVLAAAVWLRGRRVAA